MLNQSINKINKSLTPKPTVKPTITLTPIPEYILVALPNSGVVLSCKKSSQQVVVQASSAFSLIEQELISCEKSHREDCVKGCKENDYKCKIQCSSNATHLCSDFQVNIENASKPFQKIVNDNCITGNNVK